MDKKVLRQRMRRKQQQIRRRKMMRLGACALAVLLVLIFVIRGVIIPIANRIGGGSSDKPVEVQAETDETETTDEDGAVRRPLKSKSDLAKASQLTVGWHEDDNGRWYQNADGTYFASGMQEIDGNTYSFDDNGYVQTGWVTRGFDDYYFNDDGTYDPTQHKPRIALTFDDGPGEYTDELLDCLEENNAHATFFMLGQNVVNWESTVQRMVDLGCEIGNHTWDHPSQTLPNMSIDDVKAEFQKTDDALQQACGQIATVARAPYGAANQDIYDALTPEQQAVVDECGQKAVEYERYINRSSDDEIKARWADKNGVTFTEKKDMDIDSFKEAVDGVDDWFVQELKKQGYNDGQDLVDLFTK